MTKKENIQNNLKTQQGGKMKASKFNEWVRVIDDGYHYVEIYRSKGGDALMRSFLYDNSTGKMSCVQVQVINDYCAYSILRGSDEK